MEHLQHVRLWLTWMSVAAPAALLCFSLLVPAAAAQTAPAPTTIDSPIQDNSFLLEEAYNQEDGVVQHISSVSRFWTSKDWVYAFTSEWPLPRYPRHQLSVTAAVLHTGDFIGSGNGFGDIALNYRYQLVGSGESRLAISPRFSLLLPTGDSIFGRGSGGTGVQFGLPLSLILHPRLATHVNVGVTHISGAKNEFGDRAPANIYNAAQSFVYTVHPRLNLMLETVWINSAAVVAPGATRHSNDVFVSPGFRWAHNFASGLQIVPGVAVPVGVGPSAGERGLLLYLSFEYRMWGER